MPLSPAVNACRQRSAFVASGKDQVSIYDCLLPVRIDLQVIDYQSSIRDLAGQREGVEFASRCRHGKPRLRDALALDAPGLVVALGQDATGSLLRQLPPPAIVPSHPGAGLSALRFFAMAKFHGWYWVATRLAYVTAFALHTTMVFVFC